MSRVLLFTNLPNNSIINAQSVEVENMSKKLLSLLLIMSFAAFSFGQTVETKKSEADEKLEKDAVEFLRETSAEVGRMRSMENRISFSSELASLMWFHDEKEAKLMYGGVVSDFKQLIAQFDAEMNSTAVPTDDETDGGGIFGGYGRSKVERKFRIAMMVRQQIAMSLAEHAPDLAYNFFYDSLNLVSNPQFRKETEQSDKYFEFKLIKQIAETDAAKAAEYGKESIKAGLDTNHIDLLKKIYARDAEKGIDFGSAMLSRIKGDKTSVKGLYVYKSLLTFGAENLEASKKSGAKKPVYTATDLRDIAEVFALAILDNTTPEGANAAVGYVDLIERYAPGRAAQIRAKFKNKGAPSVAIPRGMGNSVNTVSTVAYGTGMGNSNTATMTPRANAEYDAAQARDKREKQMMEDMKGLGNKDLPKDERDKVVASARKIIAETKGRDKKIAALSMLAAQVAKAGDKDLADEIMRDAERMVNPNPKNYQDFLYSWMLAAGYAESNPDKAFPVLESTILRANDTINAFIKVAEFVDTNEEIIADGEVQVGMFGGSMIRDLTGELGMASGTIRSLVRADFVKTKNLTDTFDRAEIRILAKMMVLRAVLDDRKTKPDDEMMMKDGDYDAGDGDTEVSAPPRAMPASNKPF